MTEEPQRIIAYIRIAGADQIHAVPCVFRFDTMTTANIYRHDWKRTVLERFRKYKVIIEIPWENANVERIDIYGWPEDVTFSFELGGVRGSLQEMSESQVRQWISRIPVRDLPRLPQT
jgi:hypothetical protein